MNWTIKIKILLVCTILQNSALAQGYQPIKISYHQAKNSLNAIMIKKLLMEKGIPSEFIKLENRQNSCKNTRTTTIESLLELCLEENEKLKIHYFERAAFFDQLGPFFRKDQG